MGKKMRFRDSGDDESCFCTFKMSAERQFNPYSFKISSYPWAIHRVRDGKIVMEQWDDDFHRCETGGFLRLRDHGEPLDYCFLLGLRDWFAQHMNWEIAYSEYWMRIDRAVGAAVGRPDTDDLDVDDAAPETADSEQSEDSQNEDVATDEQIKQNDLLNSFYIRDLERIIDSVKKDDSAVSDCFHRFLDHNTENKINIEKDREALLELLAPQHLPKGKWPSNYGLRLMPQVDVNAFLGDDAKYHRSLFSVNGRPGTGKTTMLKDIIAAIIVARAIQMCEFDIRGREFGGTV